MNDNIKSKETEVYSNGLSRTCRYRDFSMNRVCYFGGKATGIIGCIGCHDATNEYGEAMTECDGENMHNCYRCWEEWSGWCHRITRPPQSWQYVGEVE